MEDARSEYPYRQSISRMWKVMLCESGGRADYYGRTNGLFQYKHDTWNGYWNPYRYESILDSQAQIFATAKAWRDGHAGWWSECY